MSIRETLSEKPVLKWLAFGGVTIVVLLIVFRTSILGGGGERPSISELRSDMTIRDAESGDTWTMTRADVERELFLRAHKGVLDTKIGLPNPKTGTLTGFPSEDWEDMVARIQESVAEVKD